MRKCSMIQRLDNGKVQTMNRTIVRTFISFLCLCFGAIIKNANLLERSEDNYCGIYIQMNWLICITQKSHDIFINIVRLDNYNRY